MREIRVSLDGNTIAVRSDAPEDAWNAWGVLNVPNGGGWVNAAHVEDWAVLIIETE